MISNLWLEVDNLEFHHFHLDKVYNDRRLQYAYLFESDFPQKYGKCDSRKQDRTGLSTSKIKKTFCFYFMSFINHDIATF